MAKPKKGETIGSTNFPLYTIKMIGERHFMVAGGGGQAKTGIANAFEIFEVRYSDGFVVADKVLHYETGPHAVMNSAVIPSGKDYLLAAGLEDSTQIYTLKYKVVKKKDGTSDGIRKRKGNLTQSEDHNAAPTIVTFDIDEGPKIATDFHKDGGFQKVVVFNKDHTMLLTGGADGKIRCWQYPTMRKLREIDAHQDDIDDLDIHPQGKQFASVSRDGHGYIWNTRDGKLFIELQWKKKDTKYRFRNCKYGVVLDKKTTKLFTSHIPVARSHNPQGCYLSKWDVTKYEPEVTVCAGTEILSAMCVSDEGIYLGVGTISGSVSVYISFSLQKLYHLSAAHSIFVTGVDFMPSSQSSRAVTGNQDFTLMSISADNTIKMHQTPARTLYSPLWAVLGMIVIIYLLFWGIATFGL